MRNQGLTQADLRIRMDYRNGELYWRRAENPKIKLDTPAGYINNHGYRRIRIDKNIYAAHALTWLYHYGELPKGVDHINHDRRDNRIENLRVCTPQQNSLNMRPDRIRSTSKYKGVSWDATRHRWMASLCVARVAVLRQRYASELLAALAYDRAVREWAGDYAVLNFGSII